MRPLLVGYAHYLHQVAEDCEPDGPANAIPDSSEPKLKLAAGEVNVTAHAIDQLQPQVNDSQEEQKLIEQPG